MIRIAAALAVVAASLGTLQAQEATARRFVIIGCISQETAKGGLLITDARRDPPAVYRLDGDVKQLSMLVGQMVEVTGPIAPAAPKQPPTLNVASVIRISTTCPKSK